MRRLLVISISILSLSFHLEAQLLEDTQSRLKTAKVKSSGVLFFRSKKKIKTAPGAHRQKVIGQVSPRYSQGKVTFRTKGVAPRYSSGSPFKNSQYRVSPRYSAGSPFKNSQYRVSPRYSTGSPFKNSQYRVTPRYSTGSPFRAAQYRVFPRYSRGMPFKPGDYKISPRYSSGNPFTGVRWVVKPRYSTGKNRFIINNALKKQLKYYNETSKFKGDWKLSKRGPGDQHPSSNYHFAMKFSNPKIRKVFRKWNVFWVRVNRNKESSNGVKASVRSPKFDKHEKDIWNN